MSQLGAADGIKKKKRNWEEWGTNIGFGACLFHGGGALEEDQSERRMLMGHRGGTEMTLG